MNKIIDKLGWIDIQQGKLLCVRSHGKELFYIPGGKREVGESDQQALLREIDEELSVQLIPETITPASTFLAQADGKSSGVDVQITAYFSKYSGELKPASEIAELKYLGVDDRDVCSLATLAVLDWLVAEGLI
ncbi:NUDIX domain-containing protein [Vibrio sp. SS-MA-C1-2]|uniref:NUDIX hydrolase n=1 Tax=Vibrio sp. SS-MA-C1-2 TaxID=2908646 RepID=UPI001F2B839C|nr:NUDIX domain-containing protein [Vibrio sp. SS-MA-C1-2]UJF17642.1 NUDIX domain-containing protein [Vibrio sp. SS-MA-C1-2]